MEDMKERVVAFRTLTDSNLNQIVAASLTTAKLPSVEWDYADTLIDLAVACHALKAERYDRKLAEDNYTKALAELHKVTECLAEAYAVLDKWYHPNLEGLSVGEVLRGQHSYKWDELVDESTVHQELLGRLGEA